MPDLRFERITKAVGDPWTPTDGNKAPRVSRDMRGVMGVEHHLGALLAGVHGQPIAQAAAIVEWTGAAYVVQAQSGLNASFGTGGITRLSTGTIEFELAFDMRTRDHWIAGARGYDTSAYFYGADVGAAAKTKKRTRIAIGRWDVGEKRWSREDCSFILEVFGDR